MNPKNTEGRRRMWRRGALGMVLLLAGGAWWAWQGEPAGNGAAAMPGASRSSSPSAAKASPPVRAAETPAPAVATTSPPAASAASAPAPARRRPDGLSPEQLAQIEKQWCSHGHAAHLQAMAAVARAHPVDFRASQPDEAALQARAEAQHRDSGQQARNAMRQQLQRRWIQQLQQAGDARQRAAAAYIGSSIFFLDERRPHLLQLRSLAEGSRDPLIWLLWRNSRAFCFGDDPCGPAALLPWRQIEPDNLLAWLPEFRSNEGVQAADWAGIQSARHARTYREDFIGLLLPLVERETPGLALQEGLGLINQLITTWPTEGGALALVQACAKDEPSSAPQRHAACGHAAELLWRAAQPSFFDRSFALQIASAAGQLDQAPWAERMAFVQALGPDDGDKFLAVHFRHQWAEQGCDAQPRLRQQLQQIALSGEWTAALGPERAARTP